MILTNEPKDNAEEVLDGAAEGEAEEETSALDEAAAEEGEETSSAVDPDEAMAEFDSYESLDEEERDEPAPLSTPKERRLTEMRLEAKIESIVFASQKPLRPQEVVDLLLDPTVTVEDVQTTLDQLVEFYEDRAGGFKLQHLKRLGYQFQTSDSAGPIMERMFASRPRPISRAALETLAIIAYRQPCTRAEIEFIRGVDAGSIFKTLLERELIKCVGRKEIVGRPMLFGTTDQFLTVFNLSSIKDLPSLESFQPARDMVQGAMERIEGAVDLVDVEQYIADNTDREYEEGAEGDSQLPLPEDAQTETPENTEVTESPSAAEPREIQGATAKDESPVMGALNPEEDVDGTDEDSEVVVPVGDSQPKGSGDLDL